MGRRKLGEGLPADPEVARQQLVAAAEQCFDRYGVNKTTMDDIARASGYSRGTLYRYFSDRDELIRTIILQRARAHNVRADKYIRRQATFEDQLVEGLLYLVDHGRKDPYIRLLVSPEHMELATRVLTADEAAAQITEELWTPILEDAKKAGEVKADLDIHEFCTWLTYVQLILVGRLDIAPNDKDAHRRMLRNCVLPAFLPNRVPAGRSR
jgi:AcrR family transcriptional regulator